MQINFLISTIDVFIKSDPNLLDLLVASFAYEYEKLSVKLIKLFLSKSIFLKIIIPFDLNISFILEKFIFLFSFFKV